MGVGRLFDAMVIFTLRVLLLLLLWLLLLFHSIVQKKVLEVNQRTSDSTWEKKGKEQRAGEGGNPGGWKGLG